MSARYRVVFIWPDDSRSTEGADLPNVGAARSLAGTLMAPVGHLRPDAVEVYAGTGRHGPDGLEWTDAPGGPVDAGLVTDGGGIGWTGGPSAVPDPDDDWADDGHDDQVTDDDRWDADDDAPALVGGVDPTEGRALSLFDLEAVAS